MEFKAQFEEIRVGGMQFPVKEKKNLELERVMSDEGKRSE